MNSKTDKGYVGMSREGLIHRGQDAAMKDLLRSIVKKIAEAVSPEKIVLFGSYAWGNPDKNSDMDILVVANMKGKRWDRSGYILSLLEKENEAIPLDIIVYTQMELELLTKHRISFIRKIMDKGKLLYARKDKRLAGIF